MQALSPLELKVFNYLTTSDMSGKEIAHALGKSDGLIKVYCSRIYQKLDAKNGRVTLLLRENEKLRVSGKENENAAGRDEAAG